MPTAVIGNSHAKTLRHAPNTRESNPIDLQGYHVVRGAWRTEPAEPGGDGPLRLYAEPPEEKQAAYIDLSAFDTLVLSAGGWWAARNEVVEKRNHPLAAVACTGWGYDPARVPSHVQLVSRAAFEATVEAWIRDQPLTQLAFHLAAMTSAQLFIVPVPPPNYSVRFDPDWIINRWYGERARAAWLDFFRAQHKALQAVAAELGPRLILLDYPVESALQEGFMDAALCNPDPFHANNDYGAMMVDQIAQRMAKGG